MQLYVHWRLKRGGSMLSDQFWALSDFFGWYSNTNSIIPTINKHLKTSPVFLWIILPQRLKDTNISYSRAQLK